MGEWYGDPKNRQLGRTPKLTQDLIDEACKILALGNYIKTTCDYIGIKDATWRDWINGAELAKAKAERGEPLTEHESLQILFSASVKKAQAAAVVRNLNIIQKAGEHSWQAAAWTLERRYPELFSLVQRVQAIETGQPLSVEDARSMLDILKASPVANPLIEDVEYEDVEEDEEDEIPDLEQEADATTKQGISKVDQVKELPAPTGNLNENERKKKGKKKGK